MPVPQFDCKGLEGLIARNIAAGRLDFTTDLNAAVDGAGAVFIAVGTPARRGDGHADLTYVFAAAREIAAALTGPTVVVTKSTVPVGTNRKIAEILREVRPDLPAEVASNPEFLRESTAIKDFYDPPFTVIGAADEKVAGVVQGLYSMLNAPLRVISIREAEMIKYACNAFHALKVSFANEIGSICKAGGIDSHKVMEIFCLDTKLNLSPYYLKPGYAFGGSCLPKDLRALTYLGRHFDLTLPILESKIGRAHV